ncbi:hypothetical protein QQP08_019937 [Theobroma cacao]|nr:hypothetical protein QQP08_019937 [Theobroma cacao]
MLDSYQSFHLQLHWSFGLDKSCRHGSCNHLPCLH